MATRWRHVLAQLSLSRWWAQGPVAFAFLACAPLLLLNLVAIELESLLLPSLRRLEEALDGYDLVFVIGHQRSATTNVQRALIASLGAAGHATCSSDNGDLLGASLVAKALLWPVRALADLVLRLLVDTANHRMDVDAPLEEDLWMLHLGCSHGLVDSVFPSLLDVPSAMRDAACAGIGRAQLRFVRRCLARSLYWRRVAPPATYVGCPLGFALLPPELLREAFPTARWVLCSRHPTETMPSFVDLLANYHGVRPASSAESGSTGLPAELRFAARMETVAAEYSEPLLANLPRIAAAWAGDDGRCARCDFGTWRGHEEATLRELVAFLLPALRDQPELWAAAAAAGAAAAHATRETHAKRAASASVLSSATMARLVELHEGKG